MSDDEIIAVVQAHKEGEQIQCKRKNQSSSQPFCTQGWFDAAPFWDFAAYEYRVAPEPHLLKGYCFARDIHETPRIGMVKVEQVPLSEGENPVGRRKPREWWAEFPTNGGVGQIFTDPVQLTKGGKLVRGKLVRVMEVIE